MPFEEEDLFRILEAQIDYSNEKLGEKLGEISGVENLVELRNDFEKRLRSYFKEIRNTNFESSKIFCLNLLSTLDKSCLKS